MFFKIGVPRNLPRFTGKHLLESLLNKVTYLKETSTQMIWSEHVIYTLLVETSPTRFFD